jgi:hypothetical protein
MNIVKNSQGTIEKYGTRRIETKKEKAR